VMPRRTFAGLVGFLIVALSGWSIPQSLISRSSIAQSSIARSPISEASLLALERENGCTGEEPAEFQGQWPDWKASTIAGGDVPPARIVSDPYPSLHSVAVDTEHNLVFMSDPNRHALWSYDRLAASKGSDPVVARTNIRGPSTGLELIR